jgi:Flp pilus assembly protein TadD
VAPNDIGALTGFAICLVATGKLDDAIPLFRRAAELDPTDADHERNLANALFDRRNVDEASVHAARAVELRSEDAAGHELYGRILAVQGKLGDAKNEFERALQLDPQNAEAKDDLVKLRAFSARP